MINLVLECCDNASPPKMGVAWAEESPRVMITRFQDPLQVL